jgi:hypothetical protein
VAFLKREGPKERNRTTETEQSLRKQVSSKVEQKRSGIDTSIEAKQVHFVLACCSLLCQQSRKSRRITSLCTNRAGVNSVWRLWLCTVQFVAVHKHSVPGLVSVPASVPVWVSLINLKCLVFTLYLSSSSSSSFFSRTQTDLVFYPSSKLPHMKVKASRACHSLTTNEYSRSTEAAMVDKATARA